MHAWIFAWPLYLFLAVLVLAVALLVGVPGLRRWRRPARLLFLGLTGLWSLGVIVFIGMMIFLPMDYVPNTLDRLFPKPTPAAAWDVPVPQFPDAVLLSETPGNSHIVTARVSLTKIYAADALPDDVLTFYQAELPKLGWKKASDKYVPAGALFYEAYFGRNWNTYYLTIQAARETGDTQTSISVEIEYMPRM